MRNRRVLWLLVPLLLGCMRPGHRYRVVRLSSGKPLKVLGEGRMYFTKDNPAITLSYESDVSMDNTAALSAEADSIWLDFQPEADKGHFKSAILMTKSPETGGIISRSRAYNFVYIRDASGQWHRSLR